MAIEPVIRPAQRSDIPAIKSVAEDAELFPPEMLEDMIAGYLEKTTRDVWFVSVADGRVVGFGYCEPERMTRGTLEPPRHRHPRRAPRARYRRGDDAVSGGPSPVRR